MAKRLIRWFTYNLLFALLPLCAAILLHALAGRLTTEALANSPEILFFAIMVSATAMGDLSDITGILGWDILLRIIASTLLIGAIFSAILYGSFLYDTIIGPGSLVFRARLFRISIWLSIVLFVLGTLVEILVARIEDQK